MKEAAIIVIVVSFLSAIGVAGGIIFAGLGAGRVIGGFFVDWLVNGILIGWIGWAVLTYFIGTVLFKGETDIPEMMRVLGYASAPRLLGLFGFIPCVGWLIALAGGILSLIAGIIGIREAQDFDTTSAIITVVISWVISLLLIMPLRFIFGGFG
jgi:hypothetical protein